MTQIQDVLEGLADPPITVFCPFHGDTTRASGRMYADYGFHCFTCGKTAKVNELVARLLFSDLPHHRSLGMARMFIRSGGLGRPGTFFREAADEAAKRHNLELDPDTVDAMTRFGLYATYCLAQQPSLVRQLGRDRGLTDPVKLGLGWYADDAISVVATQLNAGADETERILLRAGLVYPPREHEPRPLTKRGRLWRHRLIIPEWRIQGGQRRVIFYQARSTTPDATIKYLNPSGIPKPIIGVDSIGDQDRVWICEGALDALPLIEAGEAAIAIGGSELKGSLLAELHELLSGRQILLALDNDRAGQAAGTKLFEQLASIKEVEIVDVAIPEAHKDLGEWATAVGAREVVADVLWSL